MDSTHRWVAPDGASIFYRHWRPANPRGALVLLHGVASNSTRWWEFVEGTSLKDDWSLIRIDRRGQGESVWRKPAGMREWCDDIAGILSAEGFERGYVGGHCLGANIAIAFGAAHPDRTAGLVLVEPLPRSSLSGTLDRTARARGLLHLASGISRVANALGIYRRTLPKMDLKVLDQKTRAAIAHAEPGALDLYGAPLLDLKILPTGSYFRDLLAVTGELPDFATIPAPALALLSKHSTFTDPAATRAALARLPHCDVIELDAIHWIPTEQPVAMREAIEKMLKVKSD
ncbi:hypothetical protein BWI17_00500 [Betaproteobacteria bacterium GR16-43]|nr:hypothetical protein BWI17_00500 [Betaproteobacteria bacterium GR16-43]